MTISSVFVMLANSIRIYNWLNVTDDLAVSDIEQFMIHAHVFSAFCSLVIFMAMAMLVIFMNFH